MTDNLRGIIADMKAARTGASRRIRIHIATEPVSRPAAPDNPYDPLIQAPDASTDRIVSASGTFNEQKDQSTFADLGKQTNRKGILQCHPMYFSTLESAYAVEIGGETGRWKVMGVRHDAVRRIAICYVQGMD